MALQGSAEGNPSSGNAESFGFRSQQGAGVQSHPLSMPQASSAEPSPSLSGSVSYINDLQSQGSNDHFNAGASEARGVNGSGHGGGIHFPNPFSGGGSSGGSSEGEAGAGAAEDAGAGASELGGVADVAEVAAL